MVSPTPQKNIHIRIPGNCEQDFAASIKLRILRWKDYPGHPGGLNMQSHVSLHDGCRDFTRTEEEETM